MAIRQMACTKTYIIAGRIEHNLTDRKDRYFDVYLVKGSPIEGLLVCLN